jgi:crotonobetaine/carnitine-CoA ligase
MDSVGNRTLRDLLEERVAMHPDAEWLIFESRSGQTCQYSYREFDDQTNQLANGLAKRGVGIGVHVILHLSNSAEWLLTWFALAKLGAVAVPTNTMNTAGELAFVFRFCEATMIVTDGLGFPTVSEAKTGLAHSVAVFVTGDAPPPGDARSWNDLWCDYSLLAPPGDFSNDHVAEVLFTSGSTAQPKGVELTHANLVWAGEHIAKCTRLAPGERNLTPLPLFHVNAQSTVLASLTVGATLVLIEAFSASRYWSQVRIYRANSIHLISALLRTIAAQPPRDTDRDHVVRWVSYSLNCTNEEKESFETRFGVRLSNGYGLTEAAVCVSLAPLDAPPRWPSVGLPAFGRTIRIVDERGAEVKAGEVGEILVHGVPGRTIFKGYYKNEEATRAVLVDGWLRTGDQGWLDDAGYLHFFDRVKDVIKRGGENISASEVERVVAGHEGVLECAVIGVEDPIKDEAVKVFVVPRDGRDLSEQEIIAYCGQSLARFKVPTIVEFRAELPKTSMGKIAKKELRLERGSGSKDR